VHITGRHETPLTSADEMTRILTGMDDQVPATLRKWLGK